MKKTIACLCLVAGLGSAAWSHDMWLKPSGSEAVLIYGHGEEESAYSPASVKAASGLGPKSEKLPCRVETKNGHSVLSWPKEAVEVGAEVDTGYWIKTVQGWQNVSKRNGGSYVLSEWSVMYSKLLVKPEASVGRALGYPLELVPVAVDASTVKVRLLQRGKPAADVKVYFAHEKVGETDDSGELSVRRQPNLVLSATRIEPLKDNPDADRLKLTAVLTLP